MGEFERAIADYDRAIELDPEAAFVFNNRGIAYASLGESERAIADYDRAIELTESDQTTFPIDVDEARRRRDELVELSP